MTDQTPEAAAGTSTDGAEPATRARRPLWQRVLITLAGVVVAIAGAAAVLYTLGGPSGSIYDPEIGTEYDRLVEAGAIAPVQQQFVIPIPGCTCHSTDPRLTEEHRNHRINECMDSGCHG